MSILFSDIYEKAIALFDDPKITIAYETNKIQFAKLMYTYLQNAIALFTNPASIGMRLSSYNPPKGIQEIFEGDGTNKTFTLDPDFVLTDNSLYSYIQNGEYVQGELNAENRTVTFPDVLPVGEQYAFEQYYIGEFTGNFTGLNSRTANGDALILGEIKDILARLLIKAWGEEERNLLLDIRNLMQDTDFKIMGNDRILRAKNAWIDQLDSEVLQLQNKLAWNIRFMNGSKNIGRG